MGQRGVQLLVHRAPGAGPPPGDRLGAAAGGAGELGRVAGARPAGPAAAGAGGQEHLVLAAARAVRGAAADLLVTGRTSICSVDSVGLVMEVPITTWLRQK
jgi:hypothetical protein